jgi:hypothetical protein
VYPHHLGGQIDIRPLESGDVLAPEPVERQVVQRGIALFVRLGLARAAGKGTVDYSLLHGGRLPNVDLGILQARRLDDMPPWHNIFEAVRDVLLQYVSEHDPDGVALRSAAQSIVLDAAGAEDSLSPEAQVVLVEARAVLGE